MTPESLLHAMCKRHDISPENGQALLPLIRKALDSPLEIRNRILFLVDGNLAERARGANKARSLLDSHDDELLRSVAKVMHNWTPSSSVLEMGQQRIDGEGSES